MKPVVQLHRLVIDGTPCTTIYEMRKDGVHLFMPIQPPTTTHHAKRIARFGRRVGMIDAPQLKAARALYMAAIPAFPSGWVIRPPYRLAIQFCFHTVAPKRKSGAGDSVDPVWRLKKPDLDNLAKTLTDCLAAKGWIGRDEQVARLEVEKIDVRFGWEVGVFIRLGGGMSRPTPWEMEGKA